jgi:DNA-binding transcriptional LysR family regulator
MPLDDRLREAFLSVATHGSIGRAAEALNTSQPTLSRMIKRLEQRLRVPLFDRFASGVTLTVYGEALLPFASRIDTEAAHAVKEIDRLRSGAAGVLRLGSAPSVGTTFLPKVFERMIREKPGLKIEVTEGVAEALGPALLNRRIDVAISVDLGENEDLQQIDLVIEDTGGVIVGVDHPICSREHVRLDDLLDFPWVLAPAGSDARAAFERTAKRLGARLPHVAIETWSVSMMRALVSDSGFLTWLPRPLFAVEERAGLVRLLDVEGMTIPRRNYVYRRRHGLVPPPVVRFLEVARLLRREGAF